MTTKTCIKCGRVLLRDEKYFYKVSANKDGFNNTCKECILKYKKQYLKDNKEKIYKKRKQHYQDTREFQLERAKNYRNKNIEAYLERSRQYQQKNKEKIKQHYELNKERILQRKKQYVEKNKDRLAKQKKEYRDRNKEAIAAYRREYGRTHHELIKQLSQNRRARKSLLPSTLTTEQWEKIKLHFNNRCCYCGKESDLEQEHFIPLTLGGEYTHNNILPACRSCNSSKKNSDFYEWYPKQKYYSKKREKDILKFLGYKNEVQQLSLLTL